MDVPADGSLKGPRGSDSTPFRAQSPLSSLRYDDPLSPTAARAYLAAIVASSDDAIISKDLNGIIRSCNAAAERMFGYSSEELIGRPVRILIPADRQQEEDIILERIRKGDRIDHFETVRMAKDRRLIDVSLSVSAVRDETGATIGISKIVRDITERKRGARDRERLLEAERAARSEAERANRTKDEFVAMVSHELRTPLNAILGWAQLMQRAPGDASILDRGLEVISRNTRIQAQLIADLLDISRIASGKLRLDLQPVNLVDAVRDAMETLAREAEQKGVTLSLELSEDAGLVAGDPGRLQQVIWNLLSNAIKFTSSGGRITVGLSQADGMSTIVVSDTGVGIRPEVLPYLFERFHQADRSITRKFGGLGLGLSIVKHLVELHGGSVSAASAGEGHGATLKVQLPVAAAPAAVARETMSSNETSDQVDLRSLRVLLVEDEPDTRDYLQRLLESHGAVVATACTADEALALYRCEMPGLIISDIGLPDVDGYDLMHSIQRENLEQGVTIPAIALTAYARSEDRTRALRAGYHAHVAKPAEPSELLATVASLINLRDVASRGDR